MFETQQDLFIGYRSSMACFLIRCFATAAAALTVGASVLIAATSAHAQTRAQTRAQIRVTRTFGTNGTGQGRFSRPTGVAVDSAGNVYVADSANCRIVRFKPSNFAGSFTTFGRMGPGIGEFESPQGVAIDKNGAIFVADSANQRVVRFHPSNFAGTFTSFGSFGSGTAQFKSPHGVAVDPSGSVYVNDSGNNRIVRFHPSNFAGSFVSMPYSPFEGRINSKGEMSADDLAVDKSGSVFVADAWKSRVDRFDFSRFDTTFTSFGTPGWNKGQFGRPTGIAVDKSGSVFVADSSNDCIVRFDPATFPASFIASENVRNRKGVTRQFWNPSGVAVDASGNLYVTDYGNHTIRKITP